MDCSLGSSVHGILQARMEWVVISYSRGSSRPRNQTCITCVSYIAGGFFTCWAIREYIQNWDDPEGWYGEGGGRRVHIYNQTVVWVGLELAFGMTEETQMPQEILLFLFESFLNGVTLSDWLLLGAKTMAVGFGLISSLIQQIMNGVYSLCQVLF